LPIIAPRGLSQTTLQIALSHVPPQFKPMRNINLKLCVQLPKHSRLPLAVAKNVHRLDAM
jgi:hypothetical protein